MCFESMSFEDFIDYLKRKYAQPRYPNKIPDQDFYNTILKRGEENNVNLDLSQFQQLSDGIFQSILHSSSLNIQKKILHSIAACVVYSGEVNAVIVKNDKRKDQYGILINVGLMVMLNKVFKFVFALKNPQSITYCNRKQVSEINENDIVLYVQELVQNYSQFQMPYGAMIQLDMLSTVQYATILYIAEYFIVCHELGHYLNGDLEINNEFSIFQNEPNIKIFDENTSHQKEYNADLTGFELLLNTIPGNPGIDVIKDSVFYLFSIFSMLGGRETATHPDPLERFNNINRRF